MTAAAAGLLLVAACSALGNSSNAAAPTGSGTVTVVAPPDVADAPLYIGIKDGLFRQAGLTVRVIPAASVKDEVAKLSSGQADIAFGDYADMFYAQQSKPALHLNIVANGYDAVPNVMEVLTMPGSRITSPAALKGKTIGTSEPQEMLWSSKKPYSLDTIATWSVLSYDNVFPTTINWKPLQPADLITALRTHQVNAILATEPTIYEAESKLGAIPVVDSFTGATANLPIAGYFSDATYAKQHAANLAAFRAAMLKAQSDGSMAAPVQNVLTKYDHLPVQAASLVTVGTYPTSLQEPDLQRIADLMFTFGAEPTGTTGTLAVSSMIYH